MVTTGFHGYQRDDPAKNNEESILEWLVQAMEGEKGAPSKKETRKKFNTENKKEEMQRPKKKREKEEKQLNS